MKAALHELGFGPCYSLTEVFKNPEHVGFWEAARSSAGERVDWKEFFAGYEVAVDWPACSFYEELMEAFPEAPVVLTVRDPEPWYESLRSTIYQLRKLTTGPLPVRAAFVLAGMFAPGVTGTVRLADHLVWEDTFNGRFGDRAYAMEVFRRSNEEVCRQVTLERLLVFDVREGWGPLCEFLDVEAPDRPFPHLNETKEMRRRWTTSSKWTESSVRNERRGREIRARTPESMPECPRPHRRSYYRKRFGDFKSDSGAHYEKSRANPRAITGIIRSRWLLNITNHCCDFA